MNRIKRSLTFSASVLVAIANLGLILAPSAARAAQVCTPTGFFKDGINMTAAQIGGNVTSDLDATGCNIGLFLDAAHPGSVNNGDIHGANYYGVVVHGGSGNVTVNIKNSKVHDIGETPFNGSQHGVAIYYFGEGTAGQAKGMVLQNTVSSYQKGGIVINGEKANVEVHDNTVTGLGPVNFIAQNGIQISRGAKGSVHNNSVSGNAYTGANNASSAGILIFGGDGTPLVTGISVDNNILSNNDVGIYLANYNADATAGPATPTHINAHNNKITSGPITNVSGNGSPVGYEAGISDSGNRDSIHNNTITGYTAEDPGGVHNAFVRPIDAAFPFAINPSVHNN